MAEQTAQTNEDTSEVEAERSDELRARRFLAFTLTFVAALFTGAVLGVLLATRLSERETPNSSPTLEALQTMLAADPTSQQLKEAFRREDLRLRELYFGNRARLRIGAVLLLAGVVATLLCARWYADLDPKRPMPRPLAERSDEGRWLGSRRRALLAVAGAGAGLLVLLLVMSAVGGGSYPKGEPVPVTPPLRPGPEAGEEPGDVPHEPPDDAGFVENWPRFRGPTGMGLVADGDWPTTWDGETGENILWKTPLPAPGNSSPVIWGNRIFLTGSDRETQEVLCFRRDTGELLWRTVVAVPKAEAGPDEEEELEPFAETGYAASTPATDGQRLYAVFATADVAALDFSGKVVWSRNLGNPENFYGLATSLLVHKDLLIFQFDRGSDPDESLSALLALDTKTGETVWSTPRPVDNSWSTPIVVETDSGPELITSGDPWVIAYDPELGSELWRVSGLSGDVAPSPVYADGLAYVTNEYATVMAVRTGGLGQVTETHVAWTSNEGALSDAASPVCDGTYLLQVHSGGYVTCYEAKAGTLLWEEALEPTFWASPVLAGKTVYLFGEDGTTCLLELGPQYQAVGTTGLGDRVLASPAFADSRIYVRGEKHLFCIANSGTAQ